MFRQLIRNPSNIVHKPLHSKIRTFYVTFINMFHSARPKESNDPVHTTSSSPASLPSLLVSFYTRFLTNKSEGH